MGSVRKMRMILIGSALLLGAAVVVDQATGHAGAESRPPSARERYLQRASLAADQNRLLASADAWRDAAASSRAIWVDVEKRLVRATSVELAAARFRDLVIDELRMLGVEAPRVSIGSEQSDSKEPSLVRTMTLEVRFDVPRHTDAYVVIDRLEHLGDLLTTITLLSLEGPGRIQMPRSMSVNLELRALALIESEVSSEGST